MRKYLTLDEYNLYFIQNITSKSEVILVSECLNYKLNSKIPSYFKIKNNRII